MLEITDIRHRANSIQIVFDTGDSLSLPFSVFDRTDLRRGQKVDGPLYRYLREESDRCLCRQKALDYLAMRNRTSREIGSYLERKGFDADIAASVVMSLEESGHIDDFEYALRYISSSRARRPVGDALLTGELLHKGVDRSPVKQALRLSQESAVTKDAVYDEAVKKLRTMAGRPNRAAKITFFLKGRGFGGEMIRSVMDRLRREGLLDEGPGADEKTPTMISE
jgi:regulatory protein